VLEDYSVVGDLVRKLLLKSGFCEELFFIKIEWDKIIVMFDMKEAVDYFRTDFDYDEISQKYVYTYIRDGKRHCAEITKRKY
jgi:hypothetical protein